MNGRRQVPSGVSRTLRVPQDHQDLQADVPLQLALLEPLETERGGVGATLSPVLVSGV